MKTWKILGAAAALLVLGACGPSTADIQKQKDALLPEYNKLANTATECLKANNMDRFKCEKEISAWKAVDDKIRAIDSNWDNDPNVKYF